MDGQRAGTRSSDHQCRKRTLGQLLRIHLHAANYTNTTLTTTQPISAPKGETITRYRLGLSRNGFRLHALVVIGQGTNGASPSILRTISR